MYNSKESHTADKWPIVRLVLALILLLGMIWGVSQYNVPQTNAIYNVCNFKVDDVKVNITYTHKEPPEVVCPLIEDSFRGMFHYYTLYPSEGKKK